MGNIHKRVLVACEESQRVTAAFRELGHEAYSCDIADPSGGHPEWHIKQDVTPLLDGVCSFTTLDNFLHIIDSKWDMIIAFPPCTYIAKSGSKHMYIDGEIDYDRYYKAMKAAEFFMTIYNANCDKIAIENPLPMRMIPIPDYTQTIQPFYFGHPFKKLTCLWLKGLDRLEPTDLLDYRMAAPTNAKCSWFDTGGKKRAVVRAKTFEGVAKAMAMQWGCDDE